MEETQTMLGQLRCRILSPKGGNARAVVVLCHGYGAPGADLVSLADACIQSVPKLAEQVRFVFPEAPLSLAELGMPGGRAWWSLDVAMMMLRQREGAVALKEMQEHIFEGLPQARRLLRGAVQILLEQMRLPYSKLVMGGFSQGAMLACDVALRLEEAPGALALLSGTLVDARAWGQRAPMRKGLRVLQSHGMYDPVLPFANAQALRDMLTAAGLGVDFLAFPGEHSIPGEALVKLAALIESVASVEEP